jgi:hypothetical protein
MNRQLANTSSDCHTSSRNTSLEFLLTMDAVIQEVAASGVDDDVFVLRDSNHRPDSVQHIAHPNLCRCHIVVRL